MADWFNGSEVRGAKKNPWLQTVCFCQLRDAAKGSREQWEEGGGEEGERGGERKKSPQPSHQVEH